jgi:VanZ family protein
VLYLFIKQYYKSLIIGLIILWLSLTGSKSMLPGRMLDIPYLDKLGHFAMYSFFSGVLLLDSCRWRTDKGFKYFILVIPLLFGALMEMLQMMLTTSRRAEILDMVANILGVLSGILVAHIARLLIKRIRC